MKTHLVSELVALVCCLSAFTVDAKTGYAVFAPSVAVPLETYSLNVLLTKESSDTAVKTAYLTATFESTSLPSLTKTVEFGDKQLGTYGNFEFPMPLNVVYSNGTKAQQLWLIVRSTGHIVFSKRISVTVQKEQGQIYIQMDKPIYRAGDNIRFIVFGMYNNFLPILYLPMNITMQDAKGNLVQRWNWMRNVSSNGVVELEVMLSSVSALGSWQINVTFGAINGWYKFPVEDYQLTYFEAVVQSNSTFFARYEKNNSVEITTEGRYQAQGCTVKAHCDVIERGQVTGEAELEIWALGAGEIKHGSIRVKQNVGIGRPLVHVITADALKQIADLAAIERLLVYTKVTESETRLVSYANKTLPMIDYRYLLEYWNSNPTVFRTDRALALTSDIVKADGTLFTRSDANRLQIESAASCTEEDLQVNDLRDLPSWSISNIQSTPVITYVPTEGEDLDCEQIYVTIRLRLKSGLKEVLDRVHKSFNRFSSAVQIKTSWEDGKVEIRQKRPNQLVTFKISTEVVVPAFHWMVVSRGQVFETGFESRDYLQSVTMMFNATSKHLPRASILAWTTLNNELVVDALEFTVVDNTITVDYSTGSSAANDNFGSNAVTQVRSPVALRFNTSAGSFVQYLVIDEKALIFMNSRKSQQAVQESALQGQNNDFVAASANTLNENFLEVARKMNEHLASLAGPHKDSASNTYEVFKQSKITLETSYTGTQGLPRGGRSALVPGAIEEENSVRVLFPEVFLFDNAIAPSSGSFIVRERTPDVITNWYVAALSLHPTKSLHVSNVVKIPVHHDFYLSIYVPTLVYKCNETVTASVYVYNTRSIQVSAILTMVGQSTYKVDGRPRNVSVSKSVTVAPFSNTIVTFSIQFVEVGSHPVIVSGITTDGRKDALQTIVNVKPEGVPVREDKPPVYCWSNQTQCSHTVVLKPPEESCTQATLGEVNAVITPLFVESGNQINEDNANNLPYPINCCEQIMAPMTELTYMMRTLRRAGQTSEQVEARAKSNLLDALQKYLGQCSRSNGSVSSWGNMYNYRGSTVLTSFVARMLLAAGEILPDTSAWQQARKSIAWLLRNQLSNGCFPAFPPGEFPTHFPWYPRLETGYFENATATAYALISLLEHPVIGREFAATQASKINQGCNFLRSFYTTTSDVQYLAISAYALQLCADRVLDRNARDAAIAIERRMRQLQYSLDGKTFWPFGRSPDMFAAVLSGAIPASTTEVETAAFMHQYYFLQQRANDATPIFRFLLSERNSQHKLPRLASSTHSTSLGQQAIGDYILMQKFAVMQKGTVKLEAVGYKWSKEITVSSGTLNPIVVAMPYGVQAVKVTSTAGLSQIYFSTLKYYLSPFHAYTNYHSGALETHVYAAPTSEDHSFAMIEICNRWRRNETVGMIVSLVEMQSGYALHSTLKDLQAQHPIPGGGNMVGNLEQLNDKNFAIYYDFLFGYEQVCTEVLLRRSLKVDTLASATVRSYNYYDSQHIAFETYEIVREVQKPKKYTHTEL